MRVFVLKQESLYNNSGIEKVRWQNKKINQQYYRPDPGVVQKNGEAVNQRVH